MMHDDTLVSGNAPDWIALARDAYTASTNYFDSSIRSVIEADLRQAQGQHPAGSKYLADPNKGRSKLFRPKTRATIRKNEAAAAEAFFSTSDVVALKAEDDNDPAQQASAAVMSALLQYRLTKSIPWFLTLVGAYQDAQTVGLVASYQFWEYNEAKKLDRPAVRLIPIENIRFDPGASWTDPVGTSPYLVELIPMYVAAVKSRMRVMDSKTGEPKWKLLDEAVIMTATKTYGDTIRLQREGTRTDSKAQTQANNNFSIVWVHKNIIEVDDVDYVYYTLGCEHLLSDPVPLQQAYFHGRRPYVIGSCIVETHKLYPSSVPRMTKDVQAEINEVANQRIDNVKLAMNKRYFARRNKQVDIRSVTRNVPGSVTLMNDTDDVKVVEFNDVTASSYKEQEVLNLDFDDVAGAFSGSSVQSNRKLNETVGGMQLLNTGANQVSGYQLRTFVETWVEPVLRQIVLLEQYYETDETLIGLCGQSAQLLQKFGIDQITDEMLMNEFTLSVNVGMGATNPTEQVKQFITGMTSLRDMLADGSLMKLGLNVEEVIKELFGKLGYKDGGRFFDMGDEQDPQLAQLQAVITQMQAALDAKMPPELLAATVRRIDAEIQSMGVKDKVGNADAVKKGSEAQFSAMQTAEVIAAVPQVAPIADELMKAAGYVLPNPAGIDPNFPQPDAAAPGIMINPIQNRRTGMQITPPGDPAQMGPGQTTLRPANPGLPDTPGIGQRQGIETQRADSTIAQAAYADGGLIDEQTLYQGVRSNEANALDAMGYDTFKLGYGDSELGIANSINGRAAAPAAAPATRAPSISGPGVKLLDSLNAGDTLNPRALTLEQGAFTVGAKNGIGGVADNVFNYNLSGQTALRNPLKAFSGMSSPVYSAYADGGLIQGPGSGTSDSIAAVANGVPLAVSDGEFLIPPAVVAALGQDFFDKLIAQYHQPTDGINGPMPTSANPLDVDNGSFVIPADVVAALGQDFFDKLVELYGGAP